MPQEPVFSGVVPNLGFGTLYGKIVEYAHNWQCTREKETYTFIQSLTTNLM